MRIAHVSDCYLPRTGGIETQVRSLALAQRQAGEDVCVITASPGHEAVRAGLDQVDGLRVHRVAMSLPGEIPIHPRTAHHVEAILRAEHVDVVHVHAGVISPFAWGAVRAAHRLAVPIVVTVHSVWGPLARPAFRASDVLVRWSRWGVVLTAVSEVAAGPIRRSLGDGVAVGVLPNGIDPTLWRDERAGEEARDDHELRVVSVLRLAPRKRAGALVDVLLRAREHLTPDVRLSGVLIGDGPERSRLQTRLDRAGVGSEVRLAGRLGREDILTAYARADVFAQASVRESFGIAALEARTFGLPVVARSQTGTGEFITSGVNGVLAPTDDGLVSALVSLGRDRGLLERMREANRSTPPAQTWPLVIAQARDYYAQAAGTRATT